jgi:hypothetical protein
MQEDTKLDLERRDFFGLAAATAFGLGAVLPSAAVAAAADAPSTDFTRWLDSITGSQKIVLDAREPNGGLAMAWAWGFLFTAPKAYGLSENEVGVAMVFRYKGIPIALSDSAWDKYKLGEYFHIQDPETGAPAVRNPYYTTMKEPFHPDMALQKLINRGVRVAACDLAISFYSGQIAKQRGLAHEAVKNDWNEAMLPGVTRVPSGLVACQGAVSRGCTYLYAG